MKNKPLCSIATPILLVTGILLLWVAASVGARTADPVVFSCGEIEECFEEQLEKNACESFLAPRHGGFVSKVWKICFLPFPGAIEPSNTEGSSGWIMPLRI